MAHYQTYNPATMTLGSRDRDDFTALCPVCGLAVILTDRRYVPANVLASHMVRDHEVAPAVAVPQARALTEAREADCWADDDIYVIPEELW